jgi:hypothetical protein
MTNMHVYVVCSKFCKNNNLILAELSRSGYQFEICARINDFDYFNMVPLLHISCRYYHVSSFAHYNLLE